MLFANQSDGNAEGEVQVAKPGAVMNLASRIGSRSRHRSRNWRFAFLHKGVLLAIGCLFIAIGILQYRWLKQIDRAMEMRVRGDLDSRMTQWSLEFYGELSSICVILQVGPDSGAYDGWEDYLLRYAAWGRTNKEGGFEENIQSDPALVSKIYIYETSGPTRQLYLLNPADSRIDSVESPLPLHKLLNRLQERSATLRDGLNAWQWNPPSASEGVGPAGESAGARRTGWQFDEDVPAIVHPLVHHPDPREHVSITQQRSGPADWIIVVLDTREIAQNTLPRLSSRYFGGPQGLEYKLALEVAGKPPNLIYTSDHDFAPVRGASVDSLLNLFGPPPESAEGGWEPLRNAESRHGQPPDRSGPIWFPVIQYKAAGADAWTLLVQRRAGSIDTIVKNVWRTNFLSGLAILVLLAVSVGLVLLAARRMQTLADLQMNFVASVSHELRTPLAVTLSAAENIVDGIIDDPKEIQEHGSLIVHQCRQLKDLMDRILSFSVSHAGERFQPLQAVCVEEIVDRILQNVSEPLKASGIHVERSIAPELPPALAEPVVLGQCLQNLVTNAMKYRGRQNWIRISAQWSPDSSKIEIAVQDKGIGIRESEQQRVFEPFYRSSEAVEANIQGTGLGLAFVEREVRAMGGDISVVSSPGAGSTFTIHLPVAEDDRAGISSRSVEHSV